ncbi:hypothetical protein Tco_1575417 [Tanacetum coccineum]
MLHAREDLMESIQNFLKKFDRIYFRETPKVLTQAWDKFFEVKHAQSEEVQELHSKLLQDLQSINEELAEYINTPSWNLPTSSYDDDDDDDDESSHEEVIHEISFKTYSNPLFDLDEEIISSEFNLIHNEDLDSTLKNDHFDTESYLLESLLNRQTLMASSPKIDSLFEEFASELITIPPRIVLIDRREKKVQMESLLYDNFHLPDLPEDFHAISNYYHRVSSHISNPFDEDIDDDNSTSLPKFESFYVDYPDSGDSTIDVVEDIPVDVPNILPTYPTLHMDFNFIPSYNDLGFDHDVSSPFGDRNKIYDPGICIEVESTRSQNARIFKASRAHGFVLRSLELQFSSDLWESNIILSTNV